MQTEPIEEAIAAFAQDLTALVVQSVRDDAQRRLASRDGAPVARTAPIPTGPVRVMPEWPARGTLARTVLDLLRERGEGLRMVEIARAVRAPSNRIGKVLGKLLHHGVVVASGPSHARVYVPALVRTLGGMPLPRSALELIPMKELQAGYARHAVALLGDAAQAAKVLGMERSALARVLATK